MNLLESRMRENCTYGLMRGRGADLICSLFYSTVKIFDNFTIVLIIFSWIFEKCFSQIKVT